MKCVCTTELSGLSFIVNSVLKAKTAKHLNVKADAFCSAGITIILGTEDNQCVASSFIC